MVHKSQIGTHLTIPHPQGGQGSPQSKGVVGNRRMFELLRFGDEVRKEGREYSMTSHLRPRGELPLTRHLSLLRGC